MRKLVYAALAACLLTILPIKASAVPFSCKLDAVAASLTECKALTAGYRLFVKQIVAVSTTATAGTWALQYGTGTNCGTGTAALFPATNTSHRFIAPGNTTATGPLVLTFPVPLEVPIGNALCAIGVGTNTLNIHVFGDMVP